MIKTFPSYNPGGTNADCSMIEEALPFVRRVLDGTGITESAGDNVPCPLGGSDEIYFRPQTIIGTTLCAEVMFVQPDNNVARLFGIVGTQEKFEDLRQVYFRFGNVFVNYYRLYPRGR